MSNEGIMKTSYNEELRTKHIVIRNGCLVANDECVKVNMWLEKNKGKYCEACGDTSKILIKGLCQECRDGL